MMPLVPADRRRLIRLLRSQVHTNIFLLSVLGRAGIRPDTLTTDGAFYGSPPLGELVAVVYTTRGGLMVPFGSREGTLEIGRALRGRLVPRLLVGPRPAVDVLWTALDPAIVPRIRRAHRLYTLRRRDVQTDPHPDVRLARPRDIEVAVDFAARMQAEELDIDPRTVDERRFRRRITRLVNDGLLYVLPVGETHGFQASASSHCSDGTQIEAVFTPPWLRGRGWATSGLTGMCLALFDQYPVVNLHVNEENREAVRLYERIGFAESEAFRLISC